MRGKSWTTKFAATSPSLPAGSSYLHGSIKWSPLIFETKLVLNQQSGAAHSDVIRIHCVHCPLESSHVIFLPAATYSGRCLFVVLFSAPSLWDYVCNLFLTKESINCTQQIESSTGGLQESVQLYISIYLKNSKGIKCAKMETRGGKKLGLSRQGPVC